jgi:hypothetical protein
MSSATQALPRTQTAGASTPAANHADAASINLGLSGIFTSLPHENTEEFEQIADRVRLEFSPEGENETFLVGQMIQARCRLHRLQRLEDHAYEQLLTEPGGDADPDARILAALGQSGNILDKLERYRGAAERSYYKALRELQTSRKQTQKAEATALDIYLKKVIYAPLPGEIERKAPHVAVNLQNEANRTGAKDGAPRAFDKTNPISAKPGAAGAAKPSLRSQMPDNLALCL